jgi:hypothetical protein
MLQAHDDASIIKNDACAFITWILIAMTSLDEIDETDRDY